MTMDPYGELCGCGNRGCWETQVSQRALFNYIRENSHGTGMLYELAGDDLSRLSVPIIREAALAGDQVSAKALEKIGQQLGVGIAALINALNPELVVFGGILSLAGDILLPAMTAEIDRRALRWNYRATKVVQAQHGFDACVMGGIATIYQAILSAPDAITIPAR
jgi:predicted NBD/HSP70 family sugar kinase